MEIAKLIGIWIAAIAIIWTGAVQFSKFIRDHEVITPEPGVRCVVVSRAFNTSVACWQPKRRHNHGG